MLPALKVTLIADVEIWRRGKYQPARPGGSSGTAVQATPVPHAPDQFTDPPPRAENRKAQAANQGFFAQIEPMIYLESLSTSLQKVPVRRHHARNTRLGVQATIHPSKKLCACVIRHPRK